MKQFISMMTLALLVAVISNSPLAAQNQNDHYDLLFVASVQGPASPDFLSPQSNTLALTNFSTSTQEIVTFQSEFAPGPSDLSPDQTRLIVSRPNGQYCQVTSLWQAEYCLPFLDIDPMAAGYILYGSTEWGRDDGTVTIQQIVKVDDQIDRYDLEFVAERRGYLLTVNSNNGVILNQQELTADYSSSVTVLARNDRLLVADFIGRDGEVVVLERWTGTILHTLPPEFGGTNQEIALSDDGQQLAILIRDQNLMITELDGTALSTITVPQGAPRGSLKWSPNGRYLLWSVNEYPEIDGSVTEIPHAYLYDLQTLQLQEMSATLATGWVLSWSPNGRYLAVDLRDALNQHALIVVDVETGEEMVAADFKADQYFSREYLVWLPEGWR